MPVDYISFDFGCRDGTVLSADDFFGRRGDLNFTYNQKKRMLENIETQGILIVKNFPYESEIVITEFFSNFVFRDPGTGELYLRPLYEAGIGVFFIKEKIPRLLIYDIRKIKHSRDH